MGFCVWGRELLPGHDFSLELGLLNEMFRTISGHLCKKLANMDKSSSFPMIVGMIYWRFKITEMLDKTA